MDHLVFVYGTLRQGESNHHFLKQAEFVDKMTTKAQYTLFDLGPYPGLIEGNSQVLGEIYRVDDATLAELDILEEIPVEYRRAQIETPFGSAWIYLYQEDTTPYSVIESGDWCLR